MPIKHTYMQLTRLCNFRRHGIYLYFRVRCGFDHLPASSSGTSITSMFGADDFSTDAKPRILLATYIDGRKPVAIFYIHIT